ncbi:MAG: hypothetical protein R3C29_10745 [Dehalococcoidia bacterium]|nr:hypothetical protein [Dehalococcoidia bacterium]MCA9826280.1 hypothetical protein [Dehalococcoidia bacterium]
MANSAHPAQLGFLVELTRPVCDDDKDLLARRYVDIYDNLVGEVILEEQRPTHRFLLVVLDSVVAMHVEGALQNDHRMASRARRAVLTYTRDTEVPPGVLRDGDPWPAGDHVAYAFPSEQQAILSQRKS